MTILSCNYFANLHMLHMTSLSFSGLTMFVGQQEGHLAYKSPASLIPKVPLGVFGEPSLTCSNLCFCSLFSLLRVLLYELHINK